MPGEPRKPQPVPLNGETSYQEWMRKVLAGELPPPPVGELIGLRALGAADGEATFELDVDGRHANPMGTLHGGILCDLGDAAMGTAMGSVLQPGESFTTLELKANFFKPVWEASLTAKAKIVKRTRTIAMVECDVFDQNESLVARLSSTCMILHGEKAKGR